MAGRPCRRASSRRSARTRGSTFVESISTVWPAVRCSSGRLFWRATAAGVTGWSPALPPLVSRRSSSRHTTASTGKTAAKVDLPEVAAPTATMSVPGARSGQPGLLVGFHTHLSGLLVGGLGVFATVRVVVRAGVGRPLESEGDGDRRVQLQRVRQRLAERLRKVPHPQGERCREGGPVLDGAAPPVVGGAGGFVEAGHSSAPFRAPGKGRPFVRETMRSTYSSLSKEGSARIPRGCGSSRSCRRSRGHRARRRPGTGRPRAHDRRRGRAARGWRPRRPPPGSPWESRRRAAHAPAAPTRG